MSSYKKICALQFDDAYLRSVAISSCKITKLYVASQSDTAKLFQANVTKSVLKKKNARKSTSTYSLSSVLTNKGKLKT